jgi:predicted outer membrane protein
MTARAAQTAALRRRDVERFAQEIDAAPWVVARKLAGLIEREIVLPPMDDMAPADEAAALRALADELDPRL